MSDFLSSFPYVLILFAFILSVFLIFESIGYIIKGQWKSAIFFLFFCLFSVAIVYSNYMYIRNNPNNK